MRRISSNLTVFHKVIFPIIWVCMCGALTVTFWSAGGCCLASFPIGVGVLGLLVHGSFNLDLADEVCLDGDSVVVRKGKIVDRFSLENIANVESRFSLHHDSILLSLRSPSLFGKEVEFIPPVVVRLPFTLHPLGDELKNLIHGPDSKTQSG